jgi:predicted dehydrogenase
MKFLIAGLGSIGRRHMHNLLALGQRDIILYRTHRSTLPDDDLKSFPTETKLDKALSLDPDAVIVSNPTSLHLEVAIPAAQAGFHLFLEKPISHSMERVDELCKAVEIGGGKVLVGYQYRFHPGLIKVKELLFNGAIGRTLSVRAHWGEYLPGWHPWEDYRLGYSARNDLGGGVVLTLSHPLDYLRWLMGDIQELWSFTASLGELGLKVEDTAEIGMRFSNGVMGSVHLDYNQQPPNHYIELIGTEGTIYWESRQGEVRLYRSAGDEWQILTISEDFERNEMFLAEMDHFISLIQGEEKPVCSLTDGVRALELVQAVKQSNAHGKKVRLEVNS